MCDFSKTIYDPIETTEKMLKILETFPLELNLARYEFLNIWVELEEKILITVSDQLTVADGLNVLLKLFKMRGKSILLSKLLDGAQWVQRPTNLELDTVFKRRAFDCEIKFQGKQKTTSKRRSFIIKSKVYDLDLTIKEHNHRKDS